MKKFLFLILTLLSLATPVAAQVTTQPTRIAPILLGNGTQALPSLRFASDPDTGFWWNSSGIIAISINGTFPMSFQSTGFNVTNDTGIRNSTVGTKINFPGIDGRIILLNNANNDFGMLQFGGTTSSFPAWKRALTVMESRLADDSGYGGVRGAIYYYTGGSATIAPANGLLNVIDSAGSFGIQVNTGTAAPTVASCGTGTVTSGSRNSAGEITATGATACTVTFGAPAWTNTPFCIATEATAARALFISASSTTAFTVSGLTAGDVFKYVCLGRV